MRTELVSTTILLSTIATTAILLSVTLLMKLKWKGLSADVCHRIWLLAMCSTLAIPILSYALPKYHSDKLAVFTPEKTSAVNTRIPLVRFENIPDPESPRVASTKQNSGLAETYPNDVSRARDLQISPSSLGTRRARISQPRSEELETHPISVTSLFLFVWGTVAALLISRVAYSFFRTRRIIRASSSCGDTLSILLEHNKAAYEMSRRVNLRESDAIHIPIITGVFCPTVLLPSDRSGWSDQHLNAVIAHELAHLKRNDIACLLIGELCCAIYWFVPFSWIASRCLRETCERACDDLVIARGISRVDYAQTLLSFAKQMRGNVRLSLAVAMASSNHAESRIKHLLDPNCVRNRLGRRSSVSIALCFAILSLGTAVTRPASATTQIPPTTDSEESTESNDGVKNIKVTKVDKGSADDRIKEMELTVVDANGKPIPDAEIHVSIWEVLFIDDPRSMDPNADYVTDQRGTATIRRPSKLRILRIWVSKSGFIPLFAHWEKRQHQDGKLIPNSFHFQMQPGVRIGGRVVDSKDQPIANANVDVNLEFASEVRSVAAHTEWNTWLAEDELTTDANGRWFTDNAPPVDSKIGVSLSVRLTHPDYPSDQYWGELQRANNVTDDQLRDETATFVMPSGSRIRGKIIDENGDPVTKGIVIWHDSPYGNATTLETEISEDGTFETVAIAHKRIPLTIVAPNFEPILQEIEVYGGIEPKTFQLKRGKTLRIKVVAPDGNPIPDAFVSLRGWRGKESLYNYKHSSVLDSGIPRRTNEAGEYVWDGAPPDPVKFLIASKGFNNTEVGLVARDEPHVIELTPYLNFKVSVSDKTTGSPIKDFRVIPVIVFSGSFDSADYGHGVVAHDGLFAPEVPAKFFVGPPDRRFRVRIESDGYRAFTNLKPFSLDEGGLALDVKLTASGPIAGKIVDSGGRPVADAKVVVATPTVQPRYSNCRPEYRGYGLENGRSSNTDGSFQYFAQSEAYRLRVTHERGFAELLCSADQTELGRIQLTPWATVKGRLARGGIGIPDERINFISTVSNTLEEPRFFESYDCQSDQLGNFKFERIPPRAGAVYALLGPWGKSPLRSSKSVPLVPKGGEQYTVDLTDLGATISGRVVPTGREGTPLDQSYSINYLVSRTTKSELSSDLKTKLRRFEGPLNSDWLLDPDFRLWLQSREHHFVKLASNGDIRIDGVSPGTYDLLLQLYEQPTGCLVESIGHAIVPVTISDGETATESVVLGEIKVPCRVGPRIGSSMAHYQITDEHGRVRKIGEFSGKHVMLQFWASWCQPCLESMPKIALTRGGLNSGNVMFAAISLDHDRDQARRLAERRGWAWANDFVGTDSDIAAELAISAVPAYFLIGPDGNLIETAQKWEEIAAAIDAINQ